MSENKDWKLFQGVRQSSKRIGDLPLAPAWRRFNGQVSTERDFVDTDGKNAQRGATFHANQEVIQMVNAALYLRRPLLVTGVPGSGKSSLIYAVAQELELGKVMRWNITSRSTLTKALYDYDAIGRLQESQLPDHKSPNPKSDPADGEQDHEICNYLRLGPLGTSLLPTNRPRALLIDEIDKADIDLPNDLLNIFEEGGFSISELSRIPQETVRIREHDSDVRFPITKGHVQCKEFPFVVLTSNGEREFPPAFLRRCLRLRMDPPTDLSGIIERHLGAQAAAGATKMIKEFEALRKGKRVATDQLMNAVFMVLGRYAVGENNWESREIADHEKDRLKNELLKELREFTEQQ